MDYQIEALANAHCETGENPFWIPETGEVLWTDIPKGRLFRLDVASGKWDKFYEDELVGGFTRQSDGTLLLFRDHNIALLHEDGEIELLLDDVEAETGRFNDVIADPEGRVFAGTMGNNGNTGGLFRVDRDGAITKLWDGTGCSNGMGFTPDLSGFYWTDSTAKTIFRFDYDRDSGALTNRREFWKATPEHGTTDGMTVDTDGNLWVAFWGGWCLRHISIEGKVLEEIKMPVEKISSCIFGGAEMNELYITTAGGQDDSESADGTLYRVRVGAKGTPEFSSRIFL